MVDTVVTAWLHEFKTMLKFQVSLPGTDTTVLLATLSSCPQFLPATTQFSPPLPVCFSLPYPAIALPEVG